MNTGWRFVELCCGSAATTLALLGAGRSPVPYQGSKWRFRDALTTCFLRAGVSGPPMQVALTDVGPWGVAAPAILDPVLRAGVIAALEELAVADPRVVYEALQFHPVPTDPVTFTAQYLFLQRLAYSGKAVGDRGGVWVSPGFNTSSAYGLPGTARFGSVKPMIPSLIAVLRGYDRLVAPAVHGGRGPAPPPANRIEGPTVVYLDPPYAGSTSYPGGHLDRSGVVALANAWFEAGAAVFVSEGEPIAELEGWEALPLYVGRKDTSPFRGKQPEWLTFRIPEPRRSRPVTRRNQAAPG